MAAPFSSWQQEYPDPRSAAGISVSTLNQMISDGLRRDPRLRNVTVTAEVSGFKDQYSSGHWYFSLKDESAALPCVMFRQNNTRAAIRPRDGDRVTVQGHVELYTRDGRVQLIVTEMRAAGLGSLFERFEALKRKLAAEGLFDEGRKRVLPLLPRRVAVITSASGAALHDILNVSGNRCPGIPIIIIPSSVQGAGAALELVNALKKVPLIPDVDAVIIGRGGGSTEDLWCFNEEIVARAVAECPVPVVSGVGHETDFTICDYAADVRASTPSNAAEIVFPDRNELRGRVRLIRSNLTRAWNEQIHLRLLKVHEMRDLLQRISPESRIHRLSERTGRDRDRLWACVGSAFREREIRITASRDRLRYAGEKRMTAADYDLRRLKTGLAAMSPLKVLDRGYAMVLGEDGQVIPDSKSAGSANEMRIRFRDGSVRVRRMDGTSGAKGD